MLSIVVTTVAGSATALAAVVLHYTERGDDQWGCSSERLMMSGKMNTNMYCTREMATCNYQPNFLPRGDRGNTSIACSEAVRYWELATVELTDIVVGYCQVDTDRDDRQCADNTGDVFSSSTPTKKVTTSRTQRALTRGKDMMRSTSYYPFGTHDMITKLYDTFFYCSFQLKAWYHHWILSHGLPSV
jgi:hypothetical protein